MSASGPTIRRRHVLGTGLAGAASLAMPAIAAPEAVRVLRFVPQADLSIIDPWRSSAFVTRNHAYLVFDTLYGLDDDFVARPQMVEGHAVSSDGLQWDLTLREGLLFHDNSKVSARDVVASLQRWQLGDAFGRALFATIDELSAPSDRLVRFRLRRPFPLLPDALGKIPGYTPCIMPAAIASGDPSKPITELIGSGPYRFVAAERVQGSLTTYERFAGYVPRAGGVPSRTSGPKVAHFDRVEWRIIPDQATAASALQLGEVDWVDTPGMDLVPLLRGTRRVITDVKDTTGSIGIMRLNHLSAPFDNPELRRIVLQAVQQADFMTAVAGPAPDGWRDGVGFFCPDTPLGTGLPPLPSQPDLALARRRVAAAGYDGRPVVLMAATDFPSLNAMSQVGGDLLRKIGFNVDYQSLDWGTVQQRRLRKEPTDKGGWSLYFSYIGGADTLNPASNNSLESKGPQGSPGWPMSAAIEALRADWLAAPTLDAQKTICRSIQAQAAQDVPYVPLGQFFQPTAHRSDITGILKGFPTFYNVRRAG